jgi:hypothetical protein
MGGGVDILYRHPIINVVSTKPSGLSRRAQSHEPLKREEEEMNKWLDSFIAMQRVVFIAWLFIAFGVGGLVFTLAFIIGGK